jgi:hypothetical protein
MSLTARTKIQFDQKLLFRTLIQQSKIVPSAVKHHVLKACGGEENTAARISKPRP